MLEQDKSQFEIIMIGIGELYGKEITKPLLRIYFSALANYSLQQVESGINAHTMDEKHGSFFPKPADIVRHLKRYELSAEERAEIAWAELERKIRTQGSYGNLNLDDKVAIAAVKGFISWKDLCMMDTTKMTWAKKEFMSLYETYDKAPIESLPKSLPGRIELEKAKSEQKGYLANLQEGMQEFKNRIDNKSIGE